MEGPSNPPAAASALERYQLFRSRIEHEDSLMVQRLSWLVASQSFLFTAYAITINGLSSIATSSRGVFHEQAMLLFRLIPVVALCTALLIYVSIVAALIAVRQLRRSYQARARGDQLPPIQTHPSTRLMGLSAPLLLPPLFAGIWSFLLLTPMPLR